MESKKKSLRQEEVSKNIFGLLSSDHMGMGYAAGEHTENHCRNVEQEE